ncbi:glycosyltransferase family 39 protein [Singulisphaera acidiphila]|uniref:Glycosyltransferase RgtA/B/C/D-like domain-containing protein n=1 Tax=Singulisphaera acidiphila (strain ATCC BAA-1392 / DSM 18658 / VKM B-2454 / MOB10) TaxID=886293 RepID=L0DH73_SINAD|nr:hypothetical protein [Singulisphaera acidiphila]AGA28607.1 hypothetical protein Sinac_4417 [Singulisphaera acidiphila DSM 18658]
MTEHVHRNAEASSNAGGFSAKRSGYVLLALLIAALALRASRMGDRSYWYDEGFSWKVITFPWGEMIGRVAQDTAPPLYYLLLKSWVIVFGDSPTALRALSVILGGSTVVGIYLFTREAFRDEWPLDGSMRTGEGESRGNRIGLMAAALASISVFQVRWASEARMYTLGTTLAVFSGWLLLKAVRPPSQKGSAWLWYAIVALAFAYTQYYALFSIAAQFLFVVGYSAVRHRWRIADVVRDLRIRYGMIALALLVIGYLPWLPGFLNQTKQVREEFWVGPVSAESVVDGLYQMFMSSEHERASTNAGLITIELCVAFSVALLWRARSGEWFVFLSAWLPFLLSILISIVFKPIFITHYFLFAHLFFLVGIAVLIDRFRPGLSRRLAGSMVLLCFLWVYAEYAREGAAWREKPGARGASAFLDDRRSSGELAVVCSPMLTPSMEGHARNRAGWRTFKTGGYSHYHGTAVVRPGEYVTGDELEGLPSFRFWAVDIDRWDKGTRKVPPPSGWSEVGSWRFPEIYGDDCEIIVREYRPNRTDPDRAHQSAGKLRWDRLKHES